jgi:hypothetical protein
VGVALWVLIVWIPACVLYLSGHSPLATPSRYFHTSARLDCLCPMFPSILPYSPILVAGIVSLLASMSRSAADRMPLTLLR